MGDMAELFEGLYDFDETDDWKFERKQELCHFKPVSFERENAELQQHNALLIVQNKELLARCDLLEVELQGYKDTANHILGELT